MLRNEFMIAEHFKAIPNEEWMVNGVLKDVYIVKEILPDYDKQYMQIVAPGRASRSMIRDIFFERKAKIDEAKLYQ